MQNYYEKRGNLHTRTNTCKLEDQWIEFLTTIHFDSEADA
jgi:hypothetical protein